METRLQSNRMRPPPGESRREQYLNQLIMSILTNPPTKDGVAYNVPAYLLICRMRSIAPPINPTIDDVYRLTVKLIDDRILSSLVCWMLTYSDIYKRVLVLDSLPVTERLRLGEFPIAGELLMGSVAISVNFTFETSDGREQAICDWLDFTARRRVNRVHPLDTMLVNRMSMSTIKLVLGKFVDRCLPHVEKAVEVRMVWLLAFD